MAESGILSIVNVVLRFIMTIMGAISGYELSKNPLVKGLIKDWFPALFLKIPFVSAVLLIVFFSLVGFAITPVINWGLSRISSFVEGNLKNVELKDIVVVMLGVVLGLLVGSLFALPFLNIPVVGFYVSIIVDVLTVYLVAAAFFKRKNAVWQLILSTLNRRARLSSKKKKTIDDDIESSPEDNGDLQEMALFTRHAKVLDTSVLIDGRILEIAQAGFIEGRIILPRFILTELQGVADSSDPLRRSRGRRGLEVVTELQKIMSIVIDITEVTLKELERDKVDEALVVLGKRMNAKLMTTDYNLNQIAKIEGVDVLNVNDLANAMKPMFLPGDVVQVEVTRQGKESHQGIAYLGDGTMLVVEDGERFIGKNVPVIVTSMLQTSAGRMVFGKVKRD